MGSLREAGAPDLSVVIPAYNEEGRIGETLAAVEENLRLEGRAAEILLVDDGSRDGTAAVAGSFAAAGVRLLRHEANRGKGAAVRTGLAASRGDWVLITDADLSSPLGELEALLAATDGVDVVVGSRAAPGARILRRQPLFREWMGKAFNRLLRLLRLTELRDTQCGFKLLRGEAARALAPRLTVDGFAYDVELLVLAARAGYRIREVGVTWSHSPGSQVHPLADSLAMLRDVLRLRFRRPFLRPSPR